MKLQIYTTRSPTKQNNEESNNDIDIARQQLNTAKEKVASSLKIYERYKLQEDALWKIADEAWIRAVSASKASREAEDRLKSSRIKVKEAEDILADLQDGISKTSPRSVRDDITEDNNNGTTTSDGDNTDSAVVNDNVKKGKNISPDRIDKARKTPLPLSPSSVIMRSSSLESIAEHQPLTSSPGEQRRTTLESNTLTTRTVPSSSKTIGGGISHTICITGAGASETNGIYQLAHVSSGGAPMYTKEGTWAGSKRTFLLSSYVSGGSSGKRSWIIWIANAKKSLYIINCKENRKSPPEQGWKAKKRRYRPAPKLILMSPTEGQLENFAVSNSSKVPFVKSRLFTSMFRSWKS